MKRYLLLAALCSFAEAEEKPYPKMFAEVGIGYIIHESDVQWNDGTTKKPVNFTGIVGVKMTKRWRFVLEHKSEPLRGWPVNGQDEYTLTEVGIRYHWEF